MQTRTILDVVQDNGFTPHPENDLWFDRYGTHDRMLRVELDDTAVLIHAFESPGVCCWTVMFSGAPLDLIDTNIGIITGRWLV